MVMRMNDAIKPMGKKNPNLPFHPAVRAGDYIFVSGQVPKDENGTMCVGNIEEETRSALDAVRRILREAGADLSDVVRMPQRRRRFSGAAVTVRERRSCATGDHCWN